MFKRIFTLALVLGAAALAPPLHAQGMPPCFMRDHLIANLSESYDEVLTGAGLRSPQQLLELWSSPESGTFTIFVTRPDGVSCVLASGMDWQLMPVPGGEQVSLHGSASLYNSPDPAANYAKGAASR